MHKSWTRTLCYKLISKMRPIATLIDIRQPVLPEDGRQRRCGTGKMRRLHITALRHGLEDDQDPRHLCRMPAPCGLRWFFHIAPASDPQAQCTLGVLHWCIVCWFHLLVGDWSCQAAASGWCAAPIDRGEHTGEERNCDQVTTHPRNL